MFDKLKKQYNLDDLYTDMQVELLPLNEFYFTDKLDNHYGFEKGNRTTTVTLLIVAVLILLISFINAVNFFMATVPMKIKSVNTRKVLGSSRAAIIRGFVVDAMIMVCVSFVLAVALILWFKSSHYASLLCCNLDFVHNVAVLFITLGIAVAMGLVVNLYPALYITSFSPALVIKGSFVATGVGKRLRYTLISFQFVIAISLLIGAAFLRMQYNYMLDYDMGFNRDNLLSVRIPYEVAEKNYNTFVDRLRQNPDIVDVTGADMNIVQVSRMGWGRTYKDEQISFQCYPVSYNFLQFMGIDIIEGRDFAESDLQGATGVFIFNEDVRREFGLVVNDKMNGHNGEAEIVGICRNYHSRPLHYGYEPMTFYIFGEQTWRPNQ